MDLKDLMDKFRGKPEDGNNRLADLEQFGAAAAAPRKKTISVAVVNQKGGCGKTTTAVNLSACLAAKGYRTLLIDLDAQAHASLGLGVNVDGLKASIYNVFNESADMAKVALPTSVKGLDIVPSVPLLSGLQLEIADVLGRESILKVALKKMFERSAESYDYVIMDCSPTLNIITVNALAASTHVLIPIQTHYYSLEGMRELFSTIEVVKERLNPVLEILGIVVTLFDIRTKVNKQMLDQIKDYFKSLVFDTMIHINVKLCEAPIYKKPITVYDPACRGSEDYNKLTHEFLMRTDEAYRLLNAPVMATYTLEGKISG